MKTRMTESRYQNLAGPVLIGTAGFISLLWAILYAAFGQTGTIVLAILLIAVIFIGVILGILYAGHRMTRRTIEVTDQREYEQTSNSDAARMFAALTQMASRQEQTALRTAQLINSEAAKAVRQALDQSRPEQPKLPLLQYPSESTTPVTREATSDFNISF